MSVLEPPEPEEWRRRLRKEKEDNSALEAFNQFLNESDALTLEDVLRDEGDL